MTQVSITRPPRAAARRLSDLIVGQFGDLASHEARMVHDTVCAIERNPALEAEAEDLRRALIRVLAATRLGTRETTHRAHAGPVAHREAPSATSWTVEQRGHFF